MVSGSIISISHTLQKTLKRTHRHIANTHAQSGTVVGGRIPFETSGAEKLVLRAHMHERHLHAATPQLLKDELCPFLHVHSLLARQKQD